MSDLQQQDDSLIFCDMSVFTKEEREHHMQVVEDLFAKVSELRESDAGYALRLPDEDGILFTIADFIKDERRCCAFIHYGMEVEPHAKGIWLLLNGGEDVKAAIREEMFAMLPDGIKRLEK